MSQTPMPFPAPTPMLEQILPAESWTYRLKCKLLGPPLVNDQLDHERLSKPMALGVLSSDCISSSAYGSEQILTALVPVFGIAAFTMLMPLTGVVLAVLFIVTLLYRDVVMHYTKAGGSYVVARDNFGPKWAQIAAVALMLDYIVTVSLQAAAGTSAVVSAVQVALHSDVLVPWSTAITVGVILLLFYGNMRGIREAGRMFALPTYLFVGSMALVFLFAAVRIATGTLPVFDTAAEGAVPLGAGESVMTAAGIFVVLQAFANGGSSLTGLEAISNGVSAFRKPEGPNARRTLVIMSCILGTLVAGVSYLAYKTHAMPYEGGTPTVISQVSTAALGDTPVGHVLFVVVSLATMLILWTGANTPFSGFPFLASFVAGDSFLPRQLTKRGHRLAFSNGIIVLVVCAIALVLVAGASVTALVAFYAIGVFTGFTMAGFGMAKHYHTHKEPGWQRRMAVAVVAGISTLTVVIVFAITKFAEGAWLVLVLFPVLSYLLIRLNREYSAEQRALTYVTGGGPLPRAEANMARHHVLVLVDSLDVSVLRAIRYARSLKPQELRAVHMVLDSAHATRLEKQWRENPAATIPLELVQCEDRRLVRGIAELAAEETSDGRTEVTLLLPRRNYSALLGRVLHDHTADKIAGAASRLPHVAATIVPFDVAAVIDAEEVLAARAKARDAALVRAGASAGPRDDEPVDRETTPVPTGDQPVPGDGSSDDTTPVTGLKWREKAVVEGIVESVTVSSISSAPAFEIELWDGSGGISVVFYGRRSVAGIVPGTRLRVEGRVGSHEGHLAIANPVYEIVGSD